MNLLFDQNISFRVVSKLKSFYLGCKHVSDYGLIDTHCCCYMSNRFFYFVP